MNNLTGDTIGQIVTPVGYDGTDFRVFQTDSDGQQQVDVLKCALPTGAAEEATLATLQADVAILKARIPSYLPNYTAPVLARVSATAPAATVAMDYVIGNPGYVTRLSRVTALDVTSATTAIVFSVINAGLIYYVYKALATAAAVVEGLNLDLWLVNGDTFRVTFYGCTVSDALLVQLFGHKMQVS